VFSGDLKKGCKNQLSWLKHCIGIAGMQVLFLPEDGGPIVAFITLDIPIYKTDNI
jgi:hypothetical protein